MTEESGTPGHLPTLTWREKIARFTYRTLFWGKMHVPPGIRTLLGLLFIIGGLFGFLPILGFWMLPLGIAFVALDIPPLRHRIDAWLDKLHRRGYPDEYLAPDASVLPDVVPSAKDGPSR